MGDSYGINKILYQYKPFNKHKNLKGIKTKSDKFNISIIFQSDVFYEFSELKFNI